jgi:hypothetical protein
VPHVTICICFVFKNRIFTIISDILLSYNLKLLIIFHILNNKSVLNKNIFFIFLLYARYNLFILFITVVLDDYRIALYRINVAIIFLLASMEILSLIIVLSLFISSLF